MDLIKLALEKISVGHVTSISDIICWRKGRDSFVIGRTISIRATGQRIDDASRSLYEMAKQG